ncbi:hypothetical protein KSU1_D0872 [Candidatus Jettenia caeni]|uniref:Uncharacterized protein n=1 Tax=Candidatus Jettenia caeni TaxID=247490 RepID=I3IR36_9BACT|nr:hypothetical protein KSU1_D0872 [Candidatus Jettenia caeni]
MFLIRQTFLRKKSFFLSSLFLTYPSFLLFKGGLGGIRGEHGHTLLFLQGDISFFMEHYS